MPSSTIASRMQQLQCCVVLATYNNERTLAKVLDGILAYTSDIVLVNDGSTDTTSKILENYIQVEQIHLPKNKGKGNALKKGFKKALDLGFTHALTLDTDGQHYPNDIPNLITCLEESVSKNTLIIGDRKMRTADVLAQSAKGNSVSGFWVTFLTGLKLTDSQSGFRIYPIKALKKVRWVWWSNKFEFETEAIIRSHWRGMKVVNTPIDVLYPEDRVSHFRPFWDITRITILIIGFIFVKGLYIVPRDLWRSLKSKGVRKFFVEDFFGNNDSPQKKALSIALGVFIGLSPIWGLHTVVVIFLAILFKLNKVIAFTFSNVSLPPFIPFVLWGSVAMGNAVMGENATYSISDFTSLKAVTHLQNYLIGSLVLSIVGGLICGILGYLILKMFKKSTVPARA